MNLYQANQVGEYWIVDPSNEIIDVYKFRDGSYQFPISYTKTDSITYAIGDSKTHINMADIFIS